VRNVNSRKQFLNPVVADGIVQDVDSRKQLLNPVVVDKAMQFLTL
jgi:hypothetical protein